MLERPIIGKALSKKPQMRFSDCREFINTLDRVHAQSISEDAEQQADSPQNKKRPGKFSSNSNKPKRHAPFQNNVSSRHHKQPEESSSCITESRGQVSDQRRNIDVLPELLSSAEDAKNHSGQNEGTTNVPKKSLFIGLGGTGTQSLMGLRQKTRETDQDRLKCEQLGFLLIDTDQRGIETVLDPDRKERMPYHATVLIPLKTPQYYRQNSKTDFRQLSRRWVYNIPRSLKTEGVRPLGMLAFLDNAAIVFDALHDSILEVAKSNGDDQYSEPIEIQIVSSAHGGTGSAIAAEVGFMIRQLAAEMEIPLNVELILTCATPNGIASSDLATASALACLMEINHYFQTEGLHPQIDQISESSAINQPPFDHVLLVYGGQCGNNRDWEAATVQVSDYLWACTETELGARIEETRIVAKSTETDQMDQSWTSWLSTVNSRQVEIASKIEPLEAASRLCLRASLQWSIALNDVVSERTDKDSRETSDSKLLERMDFFVGDMFRTNRWTAQAWVQECMDCLIHSSEQLDPPELVRDTEKNCDSSYNGINLDITQRRELEQVCEQLALDVQNATQTISKLITVTQDKLADWLVSRWLTSPLEWSHLKDIVRLVASKFSVNANSLEVVSQKLAANHDAYLERLYSGEQKSSSEIEQQLHAMALESRFHSLGAKMLARMAEHMAYLEDLWHNECKLLLAEFNDWVDELSKRVGIRIDNSLQSNSFLSALLKTENDDTASKEIRKSLQSFVGNRLRDVVRSSQKPDVKGQRKSLSFNDILENATHSFGQNGPATNTVNRTDTSLSSDTTAESSRTSPVSKSLQINSTLTDPSSSCTLDVSALDKRSLEIEFDSTRPYLVEYGGAVRNVALLPNIVAEQLDSIQKATLEENKVAIIVSHRCRETSILCLGERLLLSDIMERVWMPSTDIWNLANRVLARVDVDWLPVNS